MKRSLVAAVVAAGVVVSTAVAPARAGFRIQEADPEFASEVTTSWFQQGVVRIDGALEGLTILVDLKAGEGWLVDPTLKRYAGGSFATLAEELRTFDEQEMAEADAAEGDEAGEAGEGAVEETPAAPEKPRKVEIKDAGPGERLQGYDTHKYQVLVDGELLEELWHAPKLEIEKEVDLGAYSLAMQKMLGGGLSLGQGYEDSPAYLALRSSGYPLRQVLYFVGEKSTLEVTGVLQQAFPTEDFAVPKGYARVGYTELLLGEGE